MIEFIQNLLSFEVPPKETEAYRDMVFNLFLITLSIIIPLAFLDDIKESFTKVSKCIKSRF